MDGLILRRDDLVFFSTRYYDLRESRAKQAGLFLQKKRIYFFLFFSGLGDGGEECKVKRCELFLVSSCSDLLTSKEMRLSKKGEVEKHNVEGVEVEPNEQTNAWGEKRRFRKRETLVGIRGSRASLNIQNRQDLQVPRCKRPRVSNIKKQKETAKPYALGGGRPRRGSRGVCACSVEQYRSQVVYGDGESVCTCTRQTGGGRPSHSSLLDDDDVRITFLFFLFLFFCLSPSLQLPAVVVWACKKFQFSV